MRAGAFPESRFVACAGLDFELIPGGAFQSRELLDGLREEVLEIAFRSRGWEGAEQREHFRRCFKLGPLYEARALGLIRRAGALVGLAGSVNDWQVAQGSIVHLCSLGLLPEVQSRGILPVLMALLWKVTLEEPRAREDLARGRLFTTAITQSPYILWFLSRIAEICPGPERPQPAAGELAIARAVVARFDPHLALEEEHLILRGECEFRYRRTPYSPDRRLNRFCDRHLRSDEGDVFVVVGRIRPDRLAGFFDQVEAAFPRLLASLGGHLPGGAAVAGAEQEERL